MTRLYARFHPHDHPHFSPEVRSAASSGEDLPAAQTERLFLRREVSARPAYAPLPDTPDKNHRYSLVTRFTRSPIEPTRPQVCHHIHFYFVFAFFFSSSVHSQALPAQP